MKKPTLILTLALAAVACLSMAASAPAQTRTFSGSCEISGLVTPKRPINILPLPLGAKFSFAGTGTCSGSLDGRPVVQRQAGYEIPLGEVFFDTCQLGPDLSLKGPLTILVRPGKVRKVKTKKGKTKRVKTKPVFATFPLGLDMLRVANVGPFILRGPGGGQAFGIAQLGGVDPAACANPGGGITEATLSARFETDSPFIGS